MSDHLNHYTTIVNPIISGSLLWYNGFPTLLLKALNIENQTFQKMLVNQRGMNVYKNRGPNKKSSTWGAFQSNTDCHGVWACLFAICWQTVNISQVFVFSTTLLSHKENFKLDQLRHEHMLQVTCEPCHAETGLEHFLSPPVRMYGGLICIVFWFPLLLSEEVHRANYV